MVVRGGLGAFQNTANRVAARAFGALGFSQTMDLQNAPLPLTTAELSFSPVSDPPYTHTSVFLFPQHLQLPYVVQWNLSWRNLSGEIRLSRLPGWELPADAFSWNAALTSQLKILNSGKSIISRPASPRTTRQCS
jgi:hypothetical protein